MLLSALAKLEPAPKMPMEPGEPLELDEMNRIALAALEAGQTASQAIQEHLFPWWQLAALLGLLLVLPSFISWMKEYQARPAPLWLSRSEALTLLGQSKRLSGRAALDQIHAIFYKLSPLEGDQALHYENLKKLLEQERYRSDEPDPGTILALQRELETLLNSRYANRAV